MWLNSVIPCDVSHHFEMQFPAATRSICLLECNDPERIAPDLGTEQFKPLADMPGTEFDMGAAARLPVLEEWYVARAK